MHELIQFEDDLQIGSHPLMYRNGTISLCGMLLLLDDWMLKKHYHSNRVKMFSLGINDFFQALLSPAILSLPLFYKTFFLWYDDDLHWRTGYFYQLRPNEISVFIFDSAPLFSHPLKEEDAESNSDIDSDSGSCTNIRTNIHSNVGMDIDSDAYPPTIRVYRNTTFINPENHREMSHQNTNVGCSVFSLKYLHKLLDDPDMYLNICPANQYEKSNGVDYTFDMPPQLLYLSQSSAIRSLAPLSIQEKAMKKRDIPQPGTRDDQNNTIRHFCIKYRNRLEYLSRLPIINEDFLESLKDKYDLIEVSF